MIISLFNNLLCQKHDTIQLNEGINIPIRFSGNKKLWQDFIESQALKLPENARVIDAFGGSGIISYYITKIRPDLTVVWNDFDNYLNRVDHIEDLEQIRQDLKQIAGERTHGVLRKDNGLDKPKLTNKKKQKIIDYLNNRLKNNMYIDDNVVSTWITYGFSGRDKIEDMTQETLMVNNIPADSFNIERAKEYADTLRPLKTKFNITNLNNSKRLQAYLQDKNTFWILDPPYRETDTSDYKESFTQEIENAIKRIIRTNRVMLFCDKKEVEFYKPMFKTPPKTKNKEKHSFFHNARRIESCLYSW